ncbi:flagellin [Halorhodospira abdelmalekii]|uniref:flagellin N-terminal helical domain-containing protein n=1 Tax=Halorhodospira abdelmalekii TaxID=421629 RepID=UPI001903C352|nr:flagellin [Halorhodospira abdelmalekii]MBK1734844.1 flagellin [Halorhodospira abdelmalekii]
MAQVINTNIASLTGQRHLNASQADQQQALERLSSGKRINSASDDAAGLAISERFTSQINGMRQAERNANDGISFAQTAEGAMEEMGNLLQRVRELAVQSANDTNTAADRRALDAEVQQAIMEIDRIAQTTQFNNQNVLDGSLRELVFQVGANRAQSINVAGLDVRGHNLGAEILDGRAVERELTDGSYGDLGFEGSFSINGVSISVDDAREVSDIVDRINAAAGGTGVQAFRADRAESQVFDFTSPADGGSISINGTRVGVGSEATLQEFVDEVNRASQDTGVRAVAAGDDAVQFISESDFRIEAGDNNPIGLEDDAAVRFERGVQLATSVDRPIALGGDADLLTELGLADEGGELIQSGTTTVSGPNALDVTTRQSADDAIRTVDFALGRINEARADLGAIQNRFEATTSNLQNVTENMEASRSRILDADFARESAEMTRADVLQQAGTSVLAQANQSPQSVLALLQ